MPDIVPIGDTVAEICPFFDFSRWRPSAILHLFYVCLDHTRRVFVGLTKKPKGDMLRVCQLRPDHAPTWSQRHMHLRVWSYPRYISSIYSKFHQNLLRDFGAPKG